MTGSLDNVHVDFNKSPTAHLEIIIPDTTSCNEENTVPTWFKWNETPEFKIKNIT